MAELLNYLDEFKPLLARPDVVALSIWFHEYVFCGHRGTSIGNAPVFGLFIQAHFCSIQCYIRCSQVRQWRTKRLSFSRVLSRSSLGWRPKLCCRSLFTAAWSGACSNSLYSKYHQTSTATCWRYASQDLRCRRLRTSVHNESYLTRSEEGEGKPLDSDLDYFLDFDLAVLAKPPEGRFNFDWVFVAWSCLTNSIPEYDKYTKDIRKEYAHYSEQGFTRGRIRVLQHLLSGDSCFHSNTCGHINLIIGPSLFRTEAFRKEKEPIAMENMQRELSHLQNLLN